MDSLRTAAAPRRGTPPPLSRCFRCQQSNILSEDVVAELGRDGPGGDTLCVCRNCAETIAATRGIEVATRFSEPRCALCHRLADLGSHRNLNEVRFSGGHFHVCRKCVWEGRFPTFNTRSWVLAMGVATLLLLIVYGWSVVTQ